MIRTLSSSRRYRYGFDLFMVIYFLALFSPLLVIAILAFNNSMFPSLPWNGFTWDWFLGKGPDKIGIFHDARNLKGLKVSLIVALWVTGVSTVLGTCAAFLFEQEEFRFKRIFYFLMIAPLVVPGVIIGIALLSFATSLGTFLETVFGIDVRLLSPGLFLVVCGQCSFITTFVALVVMARLKRFDRSLEEAAFNLGANRFEVIRFVTLPYLRPAIVSAAAVAFLLSFENFNTTLFLVGSDATLPITLFTQIKDGSTPVVNAISLVLITCVSLFAVLNYYYQTKNAQRAGR